MKVQNSNPILNMLCVATLVLGLATKAKTCKDVGQEGSSGVKSHAPRSVGECEGMNLHTPK